MDCGSPTSVVKQHPEIGFVFRIVNFSNKRVKRPDTTGPVDYVYAYFFLCIDVKLVRVFISMMHNFFCSNHEEKETQVK